MNNWKVIFATAVIFGAGVVTGGLLVNHVQHSHPRNNPRRLAAGAEAGSPATNQAPRLPDAPRPARLPEVLSKQFLQQLDVQLHLATDQHEAIQKIISDGQNQMRKTLQDARLEIREVLTLEQRKDFDELVKRPFRKPIFGTNAAPAAEGDFKNRLAKILAAQHLSTTNLSPEAQAVLTGAERLKSQSQTNNFPPPPPPPNTP